MITLLSSFWTMVILFAIIGTQRGWTREVVTTAGLLLGLFSINQFGNFLFTFLKYDQNAFPDETYRAEALIMSAIMVVFALISYAGPTLTGRLSERLRRQDFWRDRLLAMLVGGINGYLFWGSFWSFVEYKIMGPGVWQRIDTARAYPVSWIIRPSTLPTVAPTLPNLNEIVEAAENLIAVLPVPILTVNPYLLPILMVVAFILILIILL